MRMRSSKRTGVADARRVIVNFKTPSAMDKAISVSPGCCDVCAVVGSGAFVPRVRAGKAA